MTKKLLLVILKAASAHALKNYCAVVDLSTGLQKLYLAHTEIGTDLAYDIFDVISSRLNKGELI
jgi:hypothetical protein